MISQGSAHAVQNWGTRGYRVPDTIPKWGYQVVPGTGHGSEKGVPGGTGYRLFSALCRPLIPPEFSVAFFLWFTGLVGSFYNEFSRWSRSRQLDLKAKNSGVG